MCASRHNGFLRRKGSSMLRKYSLRAGLAFGIFLAAALTILQPVAHAQTQAFSASLGGAVHDSSQAAVPGAKVILTSPEKGLTRAFTTDAEGRYTFALLPPATYTLPVEAGGFSSYKQAGIVLEAGQSANQAVTMQVGAVQTQALVTGEGPILAADHA